MAAPLPGCGALTVNGTCLYWVRGAPADVEAHAGRLEPLLGAPVARVEQVDAATLGAPFGRRRGRC